MSRPCDSIAARADLIGRIRHQFHLGDGAYTVTREYVEMPLDDTQKILVEDGNTLRLYTDAHITVNRGGFAFVEPNPLLREYGLVDCTPFLTSFGHTTGPISLRFEADEDTDLTQLDYLVRLYVLR